MRIDVSYRLRFLFVVVAAAMASLSLTEDLCAQQETRLYLVSGYPTGNPDIQVPTRVYRLSTEKQTLADVVELAPATTQSAFVRAYQDLRKLIVATPHFRPKQISIVDMDQPCEFRTLTLEYDESFQPIFSYVLDTPNDGLCLALESVSLQTRQRQHHVFSLLTGKERELDAEALRFARLPGSPGPDLEDSYQMDLMIDPSGSLKLPWWDDSGKRLIDMGWPPLSHPSRALTKRPGSWPVLEKQGQAMGLAVWWIGTSKLDLVWVRGESANRPELILRVYDKSKNTWSDVAVPGHEPNALTRLQPFGYWLAGLPVGPRINGFPQELVDRVRTEKREKDYKYGSLLLWNPRKELFLFDVKRGRSLTIPTGDIESAVLLIEDDVVYYRVKDRLYRAEIREGRAEQPELLAQDPALPGVYWAFTGPACETVGDQRDK